MRFFIIYYIDIYYITTKYFAGHQPNPSCGQRQKLQEEEEENGDDEKL